jgi:ABC-type oligopeptide transport system substrate-binding subunit
VAHVEISVASSNIGPIPFSNGAGYRNPKVDELFIRASSATNQSERARLYFEAQEILVNELPYLWLYEPRSNAAYHAGLRGMYEWSAKSNTSFGQDAWWADGKRPEDATSRRDKARLLLTGLALSLLLGLGLFALRRITR